MSENPIPSSQSTSQSDPAEVPIRFVRLSEIEESPTNPRKFYDPKKLQELADSIKMTMLISPIVIRPWPAGRKAGKGIKWECVVGSRRLRAHHLAQFESIPAREVNLTDAQVLEIQLIENAQREDVHPLHESDSYAALLKMDGYTVPYLAAKTGHSEELIHKRLKFQALTDSLKKLFISDVINIGHAEAISVLPVDHQNSIEEHYLYENHWGNGPKPKQTVITVERLKERIKSEFLLHLSGAPWKLNDAGLIPAAGSCTACSKRSGAAPSLFGDMELGKSDRCLDRTCFQAKKTASFEQQVAAAEAEGTPLVLITDSYSVSAENRKFGWVPANSYGVIKKGKCENAESAIYANGPLGTRVSICRTKAKRCENCPFHGGPDRGSDKPLSLWDRRAADLPKKIDHAARKEVLRNIVKAMISRGPNSDLPFWNIPHGELQVIATPLAAHANQDLLDVLELDYANRDEIKTAWDTRRAFELWIGTVEGSPAGDDLPILTVGLALAVTITEFVGEDDRKRLAAAARIFNVDMPAIVKRVSNEMTTAFKAKRARAESKNKPKTEATTKPAAAKKTARKKGK